MVERHIAIILLRVENKLRLVKRRMLRKVCRRDQRNNGTCRISMNYELDEVINPADIVELIKALCG